MEPGSYSCSDSLTTGGGPQAGLAQAAQHGDVEGVKRCLTAGARVNKASKSGLTALHRGPRDGCGGAACASGGGRVAAKQGRYDGT